MYEALLMLPLVLVSLVLSFRVFNFKQFQGIFLVGVAMSVGISYYLGMGWWKPIIYALLGEILTNIVIGLRGTKTNRDFFPILLAGIGLFPWLYNPWVTLTYMVFLVSGLLLGIWSRKDMAKGNYALDLAGVFGGAVTSTAVLVLLL